MDLKPNSDKYREEQKEKPKIEQVTKTEVASRKKSLGTKFAETFLAEDIRDVKSYVIRDIIIPTAKDLVFNAFNGILEGLLYGTGSSKRRRNDKQKASYEAYYKSGNDRRQPSKTADVYDYQELIFPDISEANGVLDALTEYADSYGQVSVGELYDAVGKTSEFTDRKYGWFKDDLKNVKARRVHGGYILTLPKAIALD